MEGLALHDGAVLAIGGVFTVLWWLLRQKDYRQEKQIELLFQKHDDDAKRLQDLELEIAKNHYLKNELDAKFDKIENAFRDGMKDMGDKIDKLVTVLTAGKGAGQ